MNQHPTCHPKVWTRLTKLMTARDNAKTQLKEQIDLRKEIKSELQELGAGESAEHLKTSRRYVVCLESIEWYRAQLVSLANKMDSTIRSGIQGKFDFAEEEGDYKTEPTEAEVFAHGNREDDGDDDGAEESDCRHPDDKHQAKLPVGGPDEATRQTEPPTTTAPGPLDMAITAFTEIPGPVAQKLAKKSGGGHPTIATWRRLKEHLEAGGDPELNDVTPDEARLLKATLKKVEQLHKQWADAPKLKYPGRFMLYAAGAKRVPVEVEASDAAKLDAHVRTACQNDAVVVVGNQVLDVDKCVMTIERTGNLKPAAKDGETTDKTTGEIKPARGRRAR